MIQGQVNEELEAIIGLTLIDANGNLHEVNAVVDTGFNGFLTLPAAILRLLRFTWMARDKGTLADGSKSWFDIYEGHVHWGGQKRCVEVEGSETTPLVGMSLLKGCESLFAVIEGGRVVIQPMKP